MSALPAPYELVDDQSRMDAAAAHAYLTRSYWAEGISLEVVARSIAHSFCVAVFCEGRQVAFARAVTDYTTVAYLTDVYVLEEHRGRGLSHAMVRHLLNHKELQGLRRWVLWTMDAHGLYSQHGFGSPAHRERVMTRDDQEAYRR